MKFKQTSKTALVFLLVIFTECLLIFVTDFYSPWIKYLEFDIHVCVLLPFFAYYSFSRLQDYENEEVPNKKIKEEPPEEQSDENLSMKEKLKKIAAEEKRNKKKTLQVILYRGDQISPMISSTYILAYFSAICDIFCTYSVIIEHQGNEKDHVHYNLSLIAMN